MDAGLVDRKIIIKPLSAIAKFKRELKGYVENTKIDHLEVKWIWKA